MLLAWLIMAKTACKFQIFLFPIIVKIFVPVVNICEEGDCAGIL
jgi:hypothetical protein